MDPSFGMLTQFETLDGDVVELRLYKRHKLFHTLFEEQHKLLNVTSLSSLKFLRFIDYCLHTRREREMKICKLQLSEQSIEQMMPYFV